MRVRHWSTRGANLDSTGGKLYNPIDNKHINGMAIIKNNKYLRIRYHQGASRYLPFKASKLLPGRGEIGIKFDRFSKIKEGTIQIAMRLVCQPPPVK